MKLIDLLVKKTNEEGWAWPGKSTFCYQTKPEHGYITKFFAHNGVKVVDYCWEKCDDASVFNELTKEQYDSAIAASDGWIEWGGGERPPVATGTMVDVKLRSRHITKNRTAGSLEWKHYTPDGESSIIAYRLHKPEINSRVNDDRLEQDLNECIGQDVDVPAWADEFRPLHTEAEMARDSALGVMQDYFPRGGWDYDDICSLYDAIAAGKIPGVKLEVK